MDTAIVLLGTLIPTAIASVFYLKDRWTARTHATVPEPARKTAEPAVGAPEPEPTPRAPEAESATEAEAGTRPELVTVMHADTRPIMPTGALPGSADQAVPAPRQESRAASTSAEEAPV